MSDQSQTAAKPPSEPVLCTMGCGFFGNNATSGCCSKCWRDMQKKKEGSGVAPRQEPVQLKAIEEVVEELVPEIEEKQAPMETEKVESATDQKPVEVAPKKKKGKKKSYKNLMASMVHSEPTKDLEKEKEALRKVTGGGVFSKIDKI